MTQPPLLSASFPVSLPSCSFRPPSSFPDRRSPCACPLPCPSVPLTRSVNSLSGSSAGVYVGCIWTEFGDLISAHYAARGGGQAVTGNGLAFMVGRISYTLGLTGRFSGSRLGVRWRC